MIQQLTKNQNWAKIAPLLGIVSAIYCGFQTSACLKTAQHPSEAVRDRST